MVPARERTQRINEILRMHPELIPGSPILPELEQISTAVTELEQVYEPLASECLAQGIVGYEDEGSVLMRLRSRRILASVTGSSKNLIRLSLVSEEYRSAQQGTTNLQIIMGRYDNDRAVLWGGQQKTSILQVLFSNEDGKGSFLAARRHTCVDVLKPMIRKATIRVRKLQRSEIGTVEISKSSQLDPNWILRISLQDSENVMIAGFAFNPWNYMECAILGTSGEIKVLEIQDPKRSRQIWTVIPKAESFIRLRETTARPNDGWGRILWIDNLGSILVATRKLICVYNFSEGDLVAGSLDSRIVSTDHCVLDINYDDKSHKHLFVLTSMSLIVYACGTMPDKEGTEGMQDILHNLVSVLHYRDTEDISLQINIASSAHGMFAS